MILKSQNWISCHWLHDFSQILFDTLFYPLLTWKCMKIYLLNNQLMRIWPPAEFQSQSRFVGRPNWIFWHKNVKLLGSRHVVVLILRASALLPLDGSTSVLKSSLNENTAENGSTIRRKVNFCNLKCGAAGCRGYEIDFCELCAIRIHVMILSRRSQMVTNTKIDVEIYYYGGNRVRKISLR